MTKEQLSKKKPPENPGVYFFMGARKQVLYIGKATNLRTRIGSYFARDIVEKRSPLIEQMVEEAKSIEWTETDSTLEALILESNLIRTHKPRYNTRSKDDKSYNHLTITKEEWPRVLVVRGKDISSYDSKDLLYIFGPFPSGQLFREALKIVRKLFQFYDTKSSVGTERTKLERGKLDFNRQLGLYPKKESRREYLRTIKHIKFFFQGKKRAVIRELRVDMMKAARQEKFEEAEQLKRKIYALEHIQDVSLIKDDSRIYRDDKHIRIEAYDVAHLSGGSMVGVMTVVENSLKLPHEYRKFNITSVTNSNDTAALSEILARRLKHDEWPLPQLIVVDGSTAQRNAAFKVLKTAGLVIPVVAVVKDDRHQPVKLISTKSQKDSFASDCLLANTEAHRFAISFHRKKRSNNWLPKK